MLGSPQTLYGCLALIQGVPELVISVVMARRSWHENRAGGPAVVHRVRDIRLEVPSFVGSGCTFLRG